MRIFAPGKLVLTGAYAVLEGAPAIVVATSRGAIADSRRVAARATPEVRAAFGDEPAPDVDASSLFVGDRKLGLGASAAILVASLAAREAERGADLGSDRVRDELFARARAAHAAAQGGGSGVDVAASVRGGALRYVMGERPSRFALPAGTSISVLACGTSARTSGLLSDVARLGSARPAVHRALLDELGAIAREAASSTDLAALVSAIAGGARALARLGEVAGAPIVPPGWGALEAAAAAEGAAFCVSGAGGGDVTAFVGSAPPSRSFLERAHALGLFLLDVDVDEKGVRVAPSAQAIAAAREGSAPAR